MCVISETHLGKQALASFKAAFKPETHANQLRQAEYYLKFAVSYDTDPLCPSVAEACLFNQYLANSLASSTSCKNYLSGARRWIELRGGRIASLSSVEAKAVAKGAANLNQHVPSPSPPISPMDLKIICDFLDKSPQGLPIKAALLIGFFGFLRASNIVSPTAAEWGGPHTLLRADIITLQAGLALVLRSTKTRSINDSPTVLAIPMIPASPICPTRAWLDYKLAMPAHPTAPAFLMPDGTPLTTAPIVEAMREALHQAGAPHAAKVSMHSLRRGGSRSALLGGADREDIAQHGTWSSAAGLRAYIPPQSSIKVGEAMASLFAS